MPSRLRVHVNPVAAPRRPSAARVRVRTALRAVSLWLRSVLRAAFPADPSPLAGAAALLEPAVLAERTDARGARRVA